MQVGGLYVPLLTPMQAGGDLDLPALAGHVERLLEAGVDGFVALGTTGEFADLTADERADVVVAAVVAVAGRAPVLAGVGAVGTAEAREHARRAEAAGAEGLLSLPPLYWKLDEDGLVRHFDAVAAATDLPLLLYDLPALSGTPLTPALIGRVARTVPDVVGVKLSGTELRKAHAVLGAVADTDCAVMLGAAELILPGLLAGAHGAIAAVANIDPAPIVALVRHVAAGNVDPAVHHHRRILQLQAISRLTAPSILALKAAAGACGSPVAAVVRTQPSGSADAVEQAADLAIKLLR